MAMRNDNVTRSQVEEAGFTVKDLLAIPLLKEARLITGDQGIHRAITQVNVVEHLDGNLSSWIRPGQFLMLTGSSLKDEPQRLHKLVSELMLNGAVALAFKTNLYNDEWSSDFMMNARLLGLPLIELPGEIVISELSNLIMERVLAQEISQYAELQNRIQSMTSLLMGGSGLYTYLDAMEDTLGNPVVVVRENDQPWMSRGLRSAEPTEIWPLLQSLAFRQVARGSSTGFMLVEKAYQIYVKQISTHKMKQAYLVLVQRNRDIQPLDALSLDRLASLTGLELANLEAVREIEGKYLEQFMQDWLSGKIVSEADWKLRAEVCGCMIPEGMPKCAFLVGLQASVTPENVRDIARRLRSERFNSVDTLLATAIGDQLAVVISIPPNLYGASDRDEAISQLMGKLLQELRTFVGDRELKLFVGKIIEREDRLQASWAQAKRAKQVAEVCRLPGEIVTYDRLGVYSLLYLIPSGDEREQFISRFMVPLQLADRKGGGRLLETLDMFFQCNGNIKLTSEKLFAHYNTVVYRLEKIQSILGISLDDPEERLQLQLTLKLGQITPSISG
ncbi:PucR family transcriptional regulator [Cohnella sp. WQ 127256]|uniref:PucR family transcriptional regulator n=1 Tax=Cohnella sp. WQ 127256 TaxID=2938790 RepID=UPI0021197F93|nr:PucR family transcriptional regulator [Cohnella sp. WQ 127256]